MQSNVIINRVTALPSQPGPWETMDLALASITAKVRRHANAAEVLRKDIDVLGRKLAEQTGAIAQLNRDKTDTLTTFRSELSDLTQRLFCQASDIGQLVAVRNELNVLDKRMSDQTSIIAQVMRDQTDIVSFREQLIEIGQKVAEQASHSAQADSLREELNCLRQELSDQRAVITQLSRDKTDAIADTRRAHERLDAIKTSMPTDLVINDAGELVAVFADGGTKRVGRVVGKDGASGATIADAEINGVGRLVVKMTDGRRIDAGAARGDGKDAAPMPTSGG